MNDIRSIIEDDTYLNETVEGSIDYYRKTLPELIEEFQRINSEFKDKYEFLYLEVDHWASDHVSLRIKGLRKKSPEDLKKKLETEILDIQERIDFAKESHETMIKDWTTEIAGLQKQLAEMKK